MRTLFAAITLLFIACLPAAAAEDYATLLARLKGGDTSIDFAALRFAYTGTPDYQPYNDDISAVKREIYAAIEKKDFAGAIALSESILARNFVNIDVHIARLWAFHQWPGHSTEEEFEAAVLGGLIKSMERSGDGKSPGTAMEVIAVSEEYSYLRMHQYKVLGQALLMDAKGPVDAMSVENTETHERTTFYFNVGAAWAWMARNRGMGESH